MKSNNHLIIIVISVIILFIFLGILWLINNKETREGLSFEEDRLKARVDEGNRKLEELGEEAIEYNALPPASEQVQRVAQKMRDADNSVLAGEGLPQMDPASLTDVMDKLQSIITTELAARKETSVVTPAQHQQALITTSDTYTLPTLAPSLCQGNSFFRGSKFGDGFCEKYGSNPTTLNNQCNSLTSESCNQTDCCIYINGNKCVAGNAEGPTITTDSNGKDIDYAYYSYKNECYGSCGKGLKNAANPCTAYTESDSNLSIQCLRRLWAKTKDLHGQKCINTRYITDEVVNDLKDYSKSAIRDQVFKEYSTMEKHYAKCYGKNPNNWPPPCDSTTDSSYGLSARCLKKLLKDSGCTNTAYITSDFVETNKLQPKSAMINQFTELHTAQDDDSLTKCYGPDQRSWPDPCVGADGKKLPDSAKLWTNEVPLRCVKDTWKQTLRCPTSDYVEYMNSNAATNAPWTFAAFRDWLKVIKRGNILKTFKGLCFGPNPNKWPGITPLTPDPCAGLKWDSPMSSLSGDCKKRIANALPNDTNGRTYYSTIKSNLTSDSSTSTVGNALFGVDFINFQNNYQLYLLCVLQDNTMAYRPIGSMDSASWAVVPNSGSVLTVVQLQDETFLGVGTDNNLKIKDTIGSYWKPPPVVGGKFIGAIQLNDGSFLGIGTDTQVYLSPSLESPWTLVPSSGAIIAITQLSNNVFVAIGTDYNIYTRSYPFESSYWSLFLAWPGRGIFSSITHFGDFLGAVVGFSTLYATNDYLSLEAWVNGRVPNVANNVIYATTARM